MAEFKKQFTPEFRAEAVRLSQTSSRPHRKIAAVLGVGRSTLRNWIGGQRDREMDALPANQQEDMAVDRRVALTPARPIKSSA